MQTRKRLLILLGTLSLALFLSACVGKDGRVWSDKNGNGIQDEGELGLEGIIVRAELNDLDNPSVRRAETNSEGFYSFNIVLNRAEGWNVIVELPDARFSFTKSNVGDNDSVDSDVDPNGRALYEGGRIDAGVLPLGFARVPDPPEALPKYVIDGHVYLDKKGNSSYDEAEGDELRYEVEVQLIDVQSGEVWLKTTTDLNGYFEFEVEQSEKQYRIKVVPPEESLAFPPPLEEEGFKYPSQVDSEGISVEAISFQSDPRVVNAALYEGEPGETVEGSEDPSDEPGEVIRVSCDTGEPTENDPIPGTTFEPTGDETGFEWILDLPNLPAETPLCWGADWSVVGLAATASDPDNRMIQGNFVSNSACAQGAQVGVNAAQTDINGNSVQISTAATASIGGGVASLFIPVSDLPSNLTDLRLVVSDRTTCYLSGPLDINNGYRPAEEFDPGVVQTLAAADGTRTCDAANNTCLMISDDLAWERTGDQTAAITLDGVFYAVQFNVLAGTVETRQADFTSLGWVLDLDNSTSLESPLRTWQIIPLQANGFPYGYLAVSDNGSSDNPYAFAISILSSDPVSEEALGALAEVTNYMAVHFRSAFELIE